MSLTKTLLGSASPVSESYSTFFGCTPDAEVFNNIQLDFVHPSNDNAIMLTDTNFANFRFGSNFEEEFLKKENGSGEKYRKYKNVLDSTITSFDSSVFSQYFSDQESQTPSGALKLYQEGLRTALNAIFLNYSDNSFSQINILPEFFISYLELNEDGKIIDGQKEEVLAFPDPINTKEDVEGILANQGGGEGFDYLTKILKFRFVPHEYLKKMCEAVVSFIGSTPEFFQKFSYYNEDDLNPKYLVSLYNYAVNDELPEDENEKKYVESGSKDSAIRKIMNFILPTENLENYEPGSTKNLGFYTIIGNTGYFKLPILTQERLGFESEDFSFSENKKVLTFDFRTSGIFGNAVIPYIYDKNRMDIQTSSSFKLRSLEETKIFESKKDFFDFFYPDLEIVNGSFDKYTIILSLMDNFNGVSGNINFGDEEFKFPVINLPDRSFQDFKNGVSSDSFIKDSESFPESVKKFQYLPKNHYSFENGNKYSNFDNFQPERKNENLSLKYNNVSYLKSQVGSYLRPKQEYSDHKDAFSFVEIPFSKYASNSETVIVSISREDFEFRLKEEYKNRISVIAKAYLLDEFGQYFPILREVDVSGTTHYTNVYEFFLQNPEINEVTITPSDESFEVTIEGTDLYYSSFIEMEYNDRILTLEVNSEDILGDGTRISAIADSSIEAFFSDTEAFTGGEVKFRVKIDQPNVYREDGIIATIEDFYPNLYSNYIVNDISIEEGQTSIEEVNTILQEDLAPSVGV